VLSPRVRQAEMARLRDELRALHRQLNGEGQEEEDEEQDEDEDEAAAEGGGGGGCVRGSAAALAALPSSGARLSPLGSPDAGSSGGLQALRRLAQQRREARGRGGDAGVVGGGGGGDGGGDGEGGFF
jgi:hypothetical protein